MQAPAYESLLLPVRVQPSPHVAQGTVDRVSWLAPSSLPFCLFGVFWGVGWGVFCLSVGFVLIRFVSFQKGFSV